MAEYEKSLICSEIIHARYIAFTPYRHSVNKPEFHSVILFTYGVDRDSHDLGWISLFFPRVIMASQDQSMMRWAGRVALVTGASSGIGREVARDLVKHGMKVVGCARNTRAMEEESSLLKEASGPGLLHPIKCDLSREKDILAMFDVIWKKFGGVDVCINNAGLSHAASLLDGDTKKWKNMLDVNVLAVAICTREAVRQMAQKGADDGQVININSISGHKVTQSRDSHFHTATKFAITAMTEGVRQELREIGSMIRIASISPGIVETEFVSRMYPDNPAKPEALYKSLQCIQPKQISSTVQYIMELPPHVQVHDVQIRPTEQRN